MSARQLIERSSKAGLSITVDGPDLVVEADSHIPDDLLTELRDHKPEIIALLQPQPVIVEFDPARLQRALIEGTTRPSGLA
ncbi:MAG TPA: hypothetical protein VEK34_11230 [Methylocella sp.]|nr:hypothetical protein [Methylocella sp.]